MQQMSGADDDSKNDPNDRDRMFRSDIEDLGIRVVCGKEELNDTILFCERHDDCVPENNDINVNSRSNISAPDDHSPDPKFILSTRKRSWKTLAIKWYLPVGLICVLVFGIVWPAPGDALVDTPLQSVGIMIIFTITGLKLDTGQIKSVGSAWKPALVGLISILFVTPLLALPVQELPLQPPQFATGLALFACMPTTISTGLIMVTQAAGHIGLALLLTVATNTLAVLTLPFMLSILIKADVGGSSLNLKPLPVLFKLSYLILLPLVFGKLCLRRIGFARQFSIDHKNFLKILSVTCLIIIPWMKVSASVDQFATITFARMIVLIVSGCSLHLVYLVFNYAATSLVHMPLDQRKAVVIMTSQKSLAVAFTVLATVSSSDSDVAGLLAVPIIVSHLSMILIDSFVVAKWETQQTSTSPRVVQSNHNRSNSEDRKCDSDASFAQTRVRVEQGQHPSSQKKGESAAA